MDIQHIQKISRNNTCRAHITRSFSTVNVSAKITERNKNMTNPMGEKTLLHIPLYLHVLEGHQQQKMIEQNSVI